MKKLLVIILFVTLIVGFTGVASAEEWELIKSYNEQSYFFDKQSFEEDKNLKTYTFWLKSQYTEAYGKEEAHKYKYKKDASYELAQIKIDYENMKMQVLACYVYDKKGNLLYSNESANEWESIILDTYGKTWFNATYAYYNNEYFEQNLETFFKEAKWKFICSDSEAKYFFDTNSFRGSKFEKRNDREYIVWVKVQYHESRSPEMIHNSKFQKPIEYSLIRIKFSYGFFLCHDRARALSVYDYDENDVVIKSIKSPTSLSSMNKFATVKEKTYDYYKKHYQ